MRRSVLLLFGGGLDSLLAAERLRRAGLGVVPLHFATGFVHAARQEVVARHGVETIDVARDYLREVVIGARHRRGAGLNACLDCRAFLLRRAECEARERGIDLLATGEVVGQRAFDQSHAARRTIERDARLSLPVVRPLEVSERSPRAYGRGRRLQIDEARRIGLEVPHSAGGGCCRLASRAFASRLRDLLEHAGPEGPDERELSLLSRGRHYRLDWSAKLVVARNADEGAWLEARAGADWIVRSADGRGAVGLLGGPHDEARALRAGSVLARYRPRQAGGEVPLVLRRGAEEHRVVAAPAGDAELRTWRR